MNLKILSPGAVITSMFLPELRIPISQSNTPTIKINNLKCLIYCYIQFLVENLLETYKNNLVWRPSFEITIAITKKLIDFFNLQSLVTDNISDATSVCLGSLNGVVGRIFLCGMRLGLMIKSCCVFLLICIGHWN